MTDVHPALPPEFDSRELERSGSLINPVFSVDCTALREIGGAAFPAKAPLHKACNVIPSLAAEAQRTRVSQSWWTSSLEAVRRSTPASGERLTPRELFTIDKSGLPC